MEQGNTVVLLVTEQTPQSQLFMGYLAEHLDCRVAAIGPDDGPGFVGCDKLLVLLDADHVSEGRMQDWHQCASEYQPMVLAAFNLRDEEQAAEMLVSVHLQGIFYRNDDLSLFCKGIGSLLAGESWMSRSLMARLLAFYQRRQLNAYRSACGLTPRELAIISRLGSGATNMQIADALFVSEHTVKSHLYNIFRKLKVHNRVQAMNWARQNLASPAPERPKAEAKQLTI